MSVGAAVMRRVEWRACDLHVGQADQIGSGMPHDLELDLAGLWGCQLAIAIACQWPVPVLCSGATTHAVHLSRPSAKASGQAGGSGQEWSGR